MSSEAHLHEVINIANPTWICDDADYRSASIIGQKLLFHIADAYTQVGADEEEAIPPARKNLQRDTFYTRLPDEFETKECVAESQKMGIHERTARRWIEHWIEEGKILKTTHGKFQKVA